MVAVLCCVICNSLAYSMRSHCAESLFPVFALSFVCSMEHLSQSMFVCLLRKGWICRAK